MVKIIQNYTLTDYLGKGEYGKVYRAFHMDTRIDVAVKMISIDKFQQISKLSQLTRNQIETLRLLQDNLNVVKFVEMIKSSNYIYLVYQFCEGGTLQQMMRQRGPVPQRQALCVFRQLINAVRSLHQHSILHRDIKPNNIFFKSGHLKLADFGFCKRLRSPDDFTQTSLGSPLYMAPQILNGDVYGSKADVWSCGVVLFQLLFGYCPYGHCNMKELLQVYNGERGGVAIPSDRFAVSAVTEMMLRRMLEKDQFRRISWEDFLYQYEITPSGGLLKKEKDFEYDLMKLMKKNSVVGQKRTAPTVKFDWTKITERTSSVHSEELSPVERGEGVLDELLQLKRKVKEFEASHLKMLEITLVLQGLLDCGKDYMYSNAVVYFLVHTLSVLAGHNLSRLEEYVAGQQGLLAANPCEAEALNKLQVVFRNQLTAVRGRANSIKVSLMQCETLSKEVFKFPGRAVLRKYLGQYLADFQRCSKQSTRLNGEGSREETLFLLRVVWAASQLAAEEEGEGGRALRDVLSVKPQMGKFQLAVQLNRYLVFLGV